MSRVLVPIVALVLLLGCDDANGEGVLTVRPACALDDVLPCDVVTVEESNVVPIMLPCWVQTVMSNGSLTQCGECAEEGRGVYDPETEAELCIQHIAPVPYGGESSEDQ